jgi:hypothetical protein
MLAASVLLLYLGRGTSFFFDEWDYVQHAYGGGVHSLLMPHNEHLSILPIAMYKVLFHVAGLNHYWVYRVVLLALHLTCAGLVYVLTERRVGRPAALLVTTLVLFLGAAWQDLLWPFQIDFLGSIAGGLAAWALLDRDDDAGYVGALAAVSASVASSGLGLAVLAGVAVELLWRGRLHKLWVVIVPAALYLVWYARYGHSDVTSQSLIHAPAFAADMAAAAFGGLVGHGLDWGRPLALLGICTLAWRLLAARPLNARLAGLLSVAAVIWVLTAISRSTTEMPDASRYVYLGAVVILMATVELCRGLSLKPGGLTLFTVIVAAAALSGLQPLHDGASGLRTTSQAVRAELGALELAAAHAPATYVPDPKRAPQIMAGPYLHTVRAIHSSPAYTPTQLASALSQPRAAADAVLMQLAPPTLRSLAPGEPSRLAPAPATEVPAGLRVVQRAGCLRIAPAPGAMTTITLPAGGVAIRNGGRVPLNLAARHFGDAFLPLATQLPPRSFVAVVPLADSSPAAWHLQFPARVPIRVCGLKR